MYQDFKSDKYSKFLSFLLSDDELSIKGYHRIIDLSKKSKNDFLLKIKKHYQVEQVNKSNVNQEKIIYFLIGNSWYKASALNSTSLLPVEYFTDFILKDELNIKQIRTSKYIKYIDSSVSVNDFEERVTKNNNSVGVVLPALTTEELMKVSDDNKTLPPKSTWIEPKLRSALLIYKYDE